jgi:uncharacterized membrane protein YbhN (UPF0104 family)
MLLSVLGYFSRAYRWQMQLEASQAPASYWPIYHAMMVGNLANLVLPRMGEVIRCSVLRRTSGVPVQVGVGTVVAERVIDVVVLLILLGSTLLLNFKTFWAFFNEQLLGGRADTLARQSFPPVIAASIALVLLLSTGWVAFRNLEKLRQNHLFNNAVLFMKGCWQVFSAC